MENNTNTVKILPLGDSITYDNDVSDVQNPRPVGDRVAYRFPLYRMLKNAEFDFKLIGHNRAGYNYFSEANNGGFPGLTADDLYHILENGYNPHNGSYVTQGPYLDFMKPDVILLHIGTAQVNNTKVRDYEKILDEIKKFSESDSGNPVVTFFARIINSSPPQKEISRLNIAVDKMVEGRIKKGEKIIRVNMEGALDYEKDMADRIHPNPGGYEKIAAQWFKSLEVWFKARQ